MAVVIRVEIVLSDEVVAAVRDTPSDQPLDVAVAGWVRLAVQSALPPAPPRPGDRVRNVRRLRVDGSTVDGTVLAVHGQWAWTLYDDAVPLACISSNLQVLP